ncbi:MAG: hypothetical protein JXB62_08355 [Pirellulales bacterium]|nr:hypothetical protein [Pirellulales bacterium]
MTDQPTLSEAEWSLVADLLERERGELSVEIRHTRTSTVREELRQREKTVKGMLNRLHQPTET